MTASLLTEIGAQAAAFVAIVAAVGFLSRLRPVRWVVHTLIAKPISGWFRAEVVAATLPYNDITDRRLDRIEHEFGPNSGQTLRDRVDAIEGKVDGLVARPAGTGPDT